VRFTISHQVNNQITINESIPGYGENG